ncbi:uncharacterized protein LOC142817724 [Rhipicephalus microplus]|uniref:uncharacterized protein LOC142817724 n=1 Tax=Rhipicephalus microplus TaxID=6941 RepID=UPI003F6BE574
MTAMFPAMLLILALIVIGSLGYIRLRRSSDDKRPTSSTLSFLPRSIRAFRTENLRNCFKTWPFKSISSAGSRLRQLSLSGSQRIRFLTFQWDWTRLEEDVPRSDELRNAVEQEAASAAYFAGVERERSGPFHWTTFNVTGVPVQHSRSSVRDILLKESAGKLREEKSSHRLVVKSNDQASRPQTMPRTRISTLSTRTLMPSRAGPRNTMTAQATKANDTPRVYRNTLLTKMSEAPDEESATCSNKLQRFFPGPGGSFTFTKGELCEETTRNYRSEVVRQPSSKQDRRAASDGLDPQDASVKEERTQSICQFQLSTAPCAWSSGQDSDNSLWTTVSWVTTNEIEDAERPDAWGSIVSSSQPSWPCEQVAWKLADRKARTCETFVVQDDSRPVTLKSPGKIAIAHPSAEVSQFIDSRWPPAQDRTRWRRRVLFSDGATLSTPGSFAVAASSVQERPRGLLVGSGEGRARRRVFAAEEEASRSPRHGFQVMRLPLPPRFERGSLSLDTALATAMLRAERRAKGSPF